MKTGLSSIIRVIVILNDKMKSTICLKKKVMKS